MPEGSTTDGAGTFVDVARSRVGVTARVQLPRQQLLARLCDPAIPIVLLEAPAGSGKTQLLQRAADRGGAVIDDVDHLDPVTMQRVIDDVGRSGTRLLLATRLAPPELLAAAEDAGALVLGPADLAIGPDELIAAIPGLETATADTLVRSADGLIGPLAPSFTGRAADLADDGAAAVRRRVLEGALRGLERLSTPDRAVVDLLARVPGLAEEVLADLGGVGFVGRVVAAGVPVRRVPNDGFDVACAAAFRAAEVDAPLAVRLSAELLRRERPLAAVHLLLDARLYGDALHAVSHLPEAFPDTVEPRAVLSLVARFGGQAATHAELLLLRAAAHRNLGRLDAAGADLDAALAVAAPADAQVRRRIRVELAERVLIGGERERAVAAAEDVLGTVGPGEDRTSARALSVLAEAASTYRDREHLQRAADSYLAAAHTWDACGEPTKARAARCALVTGALVPLGRFDEALTHLGGLLSSPDLALAERAVLVLMEGFVLQNAGRLDSAETRFVRAGELGQLQDNPRLMAAAAWGRALISAQRDDLPGTLRWIAVAENTALGEADDVLGVPFLCDVATALGGLGETEMAETLAKRAGERPGLFPDHVRFARFVLSCRRGVLGDVDAQLSVTQPSEQWRVRLLSAVAAGRQGDLTAARRWRIEAERDLLVYGWSDFAALGEGRAAEELRTLLDAGETAATPPRAVPPSIAPLTGSRLLLLTGPMTLVDATGVHAVPPGNPQRLVGAIVARGGSANLEQLAEAIWPQTHGDASRARLRNVLMRVRRAVGDILVRSGSGIRLAPDIGCDLLEFARLADDALAATRADPVLAGRLAETALSMAETMPLSEFEYEEWTTEARRAHERRLLGLLDLLSVQAEDDHNLPLAQQRAELALRIDRYSDSRYVRLAELLAMQGRSAAAAAVLDDAAAVAREIGGGVSPAVTRRRDDLLRGVAASD